MAKKVSAWVGKCKTCNTGLRISDEKCRKCGTANPNFDPAKAKKKTRAKSTAVPASELAVRTDTPEFSPMAGLTRLPESGNSANAVEAELIGRYILQGDYDKAERVIAALKKNAK